MNYRVRDAIRLTLVGLLGTLFIIIILWAAAAITAMLGIAP